MRLLTGPAGSGKTYLVLQEFRQAIAQRDRNIRLLVPTATMARHLRNVVAREGFVFSPGQITTLHGFIERWAVTPAISPQLMYLLVERAARRAARPEFARVAGMAGFSASLARTVEEFSSAGCDAARLAENLPATPLAEGFLAIYREVEGEMRDRGLATRAERLAAAAERLRAEGIAGVHTVWMDGFHSITDPELEVIRAIGSRANLTLTLPASAVAHDTHRRLLLAGFCEERLDFSRETPQVELVRAPSIERECDEIARRILEQHAGGREFRDIGVIVRAVELYGSALATTFERFGIPARFYFERPLLEHPAARYLAGLAGAMLRGWDHAEVLTLLRTAPNAVGAAIDQFDFDLRKGLPGRGLEGLCEIAGENSRLRRLLEDFAALETWRGQKTLGIEWSTRLKKLAALYRPGRPSPGATHEASLASREQAEAVARFECAMDGAAELFGASQALTLGEFWEAAAAVLRLSVLRTEDLRRNVVNVFTAYEARQWRLPVVFVCGLVEGQFPRYHPQNPFFSDAARRHLQRDGVRVRSADDLEREEQFLFDSAVTRATELLVVSYPGADQRGEGTLPSLYLEGLGLQPAASQAAAPEPVAPRGGRIAPVALESPDLLERLAARHAAMKPTAVESYLQCPFQFFGRHTLDLRAPPVRPAERLDFRVMGTIVHETIKRWTEKGQPIAGVFDEVFAETAARERVPEGYRTEFLRLQMLADLRRLQDDRRWPRGLATRTEVDFEYRLDSGLRVRGRIDRLDQTPDGRACIIDYKYSKKDYAKAANHLQAPLYWMAAERAFGLEPACMLYCGLRDEVAYTGWSNDAAVIPGLDASEEWLASAVEATVSAAEAIRKGRIVPEPADREPCRYCDYRDVCRIEARAVAAIAEGA